MLLVQKYKYWRRCWYKSASSDAAYIGADEAAYAYIGAHADGAAYAYIGAHGAAYALYRC